jgi:aspartate ammonia-lyase
VKGIRADRERARRLLDESTALVTALTPYIGYARSTEVAQEALRTGARVYDLVLQKGLMGREQLDKILQPEVLTKPHYSTVHKPMSEP